MDEIVQVIRMETAGKIYNWAQYCCTQNIRDNVTIKKIMLFYVLPQRNDYRKPL